MISIKRVLKATHFRVVTMNQEDYFIPCQSTDDGALKMTLGDVPREKLLRNALTKVRTNISVLYSKLVIVAWQDIKICFYIKIQEDAFIALRESRRGIDSNTIRKLDKFARPIGQLNVDIETAQKNQKSNSKAKENPNKPESTVQQQPKNQKSLLSRITNALLYIFVNTFD